MLINPVNEFRYRLHSWSGTPGLTYGTLCTTAINTYGTWTQLISGASVDHDCYGIYINFSDMTGSGASADGICNVGIDTAGGTSYTTLIPDLLMSNAAVFFTNGNSIAGGIHYYFPIFIPAGSSVGVQFSVSNSPANAPTAMCTLFGQPTRPDAINVGRWVESVGITSATSSGTSVTAGTSSPGSWVSLGSPTRSGWFTQVGMGLLDTSAASEGYLCDIGAGDASNKRILTESTMYNTDGFEQLACLRRDDHGYGIVSTSDVLYGRIQASGTSNSNLSIAAYVLGG